MLSEVLLLLANSLLFSLRLSGGGSFPKPLSAAEERECLARLAEGDLEARNTLVEHNLRLVAHIVKKYESKRSIARAEGRPRFDSRDRVGPVQMREYEAETMRSRVNRGEYFSVREKKPF